MMLLFFLQIVVPLQLYLLEQINLILNNERNEQVRFIRH